MIRWLTQLFSSTAPAPSVLDHLPIQSDGTFLDADGNPCTNEKQTAVGEGLSHREKLELAAARAKSTFRCAPDGLPREIRTGLGGTETRIVGVKPAPAPEPPPNVTKMKRNAR